MTRRVKVGRSTLTISAERLVHHVVRMRAWSPGRRAYAHAAAKRRLQGKHAHKRDAAVWYATVVGEP